MDNNLLCVVLVTIGFILCVCIVGFLYTHHEKKREERRMGMPKTDSDGNSTAAATKLAMHTRYNGLSTRGKI